MSTRAEPVPRPPARPQPHTDPVPRPQPHTDPVPRPQPHTQRRSLRTLRLQSNLPRYALFVIAMGVVALVAMALKARPAKAPPPPAPTVDLPAESFAVGFTRAYLTYDAQNPQTREQQLAPFLGGSSALDQDADVQLPAQGSDQVQFAQVAARQPGAGGTTYVVQADTSAEGTVYLAVTVAESAGTIRLVGTPAFVGAPPTAAAVQNPSEAGQQVTQSAVTSVVTRALTNYLEGNLSDLQSDLATGVSVTTPPIGLSQIQVGQINWLTPGRSVGVDVQATDRLGVTYGLHYTVSLQRPLSPGGGRWFITGIQTASS